MGLILCSVTEAEERVRRLWAWVCSIRVPWGCVGLTLGNGTVLTHGGTGGALSSLSLGSGEYVTSAQLCQGQKNGHTRIFSAKFTTNLGRSLSGGTTTSDCVTRTVPSGWQIAGFHGRAGDEIDKLGFVYTQR